MSRSQRVCQKIDMFSFVPVPKSEAVSTKCSLIGTTIFFLMFFAYLTFDLIYFIKSNPPISNTYYSKLDSRSYIVPKIAITFMYGEDLDYAPDLSNILNFTMIMNVKKLGKTDPIKINLVPCSNLSWLPSNVTNFYKKLMCPDSSVQLNISGLLYVSDTTYYPSIKISQCMTNDTIPKPCDEDLIANMTAGGRVCLFV